MFRRCFSAFWDYRSYDWFAKAPLGVPEPRTWPTQPEPRLGNCIGHLCVELVGDARRILPEWRDSLGRQPPWFRASSISLDARSMVCLAARAPKFQSPCHLRTNQSGLSRGSEASEGEDRHSSSSLLKGCHLSLGPVLNTPGTKNTLHLSTQISPGQFELGAASRVLGLFVLKQGTEAAERSVTDVAVGNFVRTLTGTAVANRRAKELGCFLADEVLHLTCTLIPTHGTVPVLQVHRHARDRRAGKLATCWAVLVSGHVCSHVLV